MEKRIDLEKRGRPADEIKDLNLDNTRATQIEGLTDEFVNLESLSLINVGLTTLKGFPNLPNLKKLELSDNRISSGLNNLSGCPKLSYLNLSGNKIKDIETLKPLQEFSELKNLDLFNCEVTNLENYRDKVFDYLEGLQYLDGFDRNNQEADEDEEDDGDDIDGEDDDDEEGEGGSDDDDDDDDEEEDGVVDVDDDDDDDDDDDVVEEGVEGEDDDDDDEEEEVGLSYLEKDDISDEEEGEDFEPGSGGVEDDEEDDEDAGEDDGDDESRGVKRKLEEEDEDA